MKILQQYLALSISLLFSLSLFLISCQSNQDQDNNVNTEPTTVDSIAISLKNKYEAAKEQFEKDTSNANALIWYGRRSAYLGNFDEAIQLYTKGIRLHPQDARIYRHRGHRYISTRQYDLAIADFEKAVTLIKDQNDEVEPDGLPNERNIPLSTLHGNIWYHLGLAYYLKNDMDNALKAFSNRTVTEKYDDNVVSGGHWLYMILSRMGKQEEAKEVLAKIHPDMDIIENFSYYKMCLFYKALLKEEDLQAKDPKSSSANVLSYGLGNWYLYAKQDSLTAKKYYQDLLENGNKYSFAYLAAEADWERIFK